MRHLNPVRLYNGTYTTTCFNKLLNQQPLSATQNDYLRSWIQTVLQNENLSLIFEKMEKWRKDHPCSNSAYREKIAQIISELINFIPEKNSQMKLFWALLEKKQYRDALPFLLEKLHGKGRHGQPEFVQMLTVCLSSQWRYQCWLDAFDIAVGRGSNGLIQVLFDFDLSIAGSKNWEGENVYFYLARRYSLYLRSNQSFKARILYLQQREAATLGETNSSGVALFSLMVGNNQIPDDIVALLIAREAPEHFPANYVYHAVRMRLPLNQLHPLLERVKRKGSGALQDLIPALVYEMDNNPRGDVVAAIKANIDIKEAIRQNIIALSPDQIKKLNTIAGYTLEELLITILSSPIHNKKSYIENVLFLLSNDLNYHYKVGHGNLLQALLDHKEVISNPEIVKKLIDLASNRPKLFVAEVDRMFLEYYSRGVVPTAGLRQVLKRADPDMLIIEIGDNTLLWHNTYYERWPELKNILSRKYLESFVPRNIVPILSILDSKISIDQYIFNAFRACLGYLYLKYVKGGRESSRSFLPALDLGGCLIQWALATEFHLVSVASETFDKIYHLHPPLESHSFADIRLICVWLMTRNIDRDELRVLLNFIMIKCDLITPSEKSKLFLEIIDKFDYAKDLILNLIVENLIRDKNSIAVVVNLVVKMKWKSLVIDKLVEKLSDITQIIPIINVLVRFNTLPRYVIDILQDFSRLEVKASFTKQEYDGLTKTGSFVQLSKDNYYYKAIGDTSLGGSAITVDASRLIREAASTALKSVQVDKHSMLFDRRKKGDPEEKKQEPMFTFDIF